MPPSPSQNFICGRFISPCGPWPGAMLPQSSKKNRSPAASPRAAAERILARQKEIIGTFDALTGLEITAKRIRCHGDYHLGQILNTGSDFVIIDFEGEPARAVSERTDKALSALRCGGYGAFFSLCRPQCLDRRAGKGAFSSGKCPPHGILGGLLVSVGRRRFPETLHGSCGRRKLSAENGP